MSRILILGATSEIAHAVAKRYASRGASIYLVGRDRSRTAALADELIELTKARAADVRGPDEPAKVRYDAADLSDLSLQRAALDRAWTAFGGFDRALIAYGVLGDEHISQTNWRVAQELLHVNLVSVVTLLDRLVEIAGRPSTLHIGVIGSVAGDRGRDRVALYAAAKGGLERYAEALQQRTWPDGPRIVFVKPGRVRTRMTAHMTPSPLTASPDLVGGAIVSALDRGTRMTYVPGWWRGIMLLVRSIPWLAFRRMRF